MADVYKPGWITDIIKHKEMTFEEKIKRYKEEYKWKEYYINIDNINFELLKKFDFLDLDTQEYHTFACGWKAIDWQDGLKWYKREELKNFLKNKHILSPEGPIYYKEEIKKENYYEGGIFWASYAKGLEEIIKNANISIKSKNDMILKANGIKKKLILGALGI